MLIIRYRRKIDMGKDDKPKGDKPKMEDYGSPEGDKGTQGGESEYTGGLRKGDGGQFGEVGDTGVGTDLTMTMEGDVRSGRIKGGQPGEDDVAGPAQYGGEAGNLGNEAGNLGNKGSSASRTEGMREGGSSGSGDSDSAHGHFGGDGPNVSERPAETSR
jgi:hypothetical protein